MFEHWTLYYLLIVVWCHNSISKLWFKIIATVKLISFRLFLLAHTTSLFRRDYIIYTGFFVFISLSNSIWIFQLKVSSNVTMGTRENVVILNYNLDIRYKQIMCLRFSPKTPISHRSDKIIWLSFTIFVLHRLKFSTNLLFCKWSVITDHTV